MKIDALVKLLAQLISLHLHKRTFRVIYARDWELLQSYDFNQYIVNYRTFKHNVNTAVKSVTKPF